MVLDNVSLRHVILVDHDRAQPAEERRGIDPSHRQVGHPGPSSPSTWQSQAEVGKGSMDLNEMPDDLSGRLFEALRLEIRYDRKTNLADCRITLTADTVGEAGGRPRERGGGAVGGVLGAVRGDVRAVGARPRRRWPTSARQLPRR
ncbi:hypothetical protein ACTWP5_17570 [Streptomyces sp. 4N509B]|uniref:hypothetical protein n=1 Tax=Streptomyces sp. 4N509B TaxID=3457413 RepID=UPI003FD37F19